MRLSCLWRWLGQWSSGCRKVVVRGGSRHGQVCGLGALDGEAAAVWVGSIRVCRLGLVV